MEILKLIFNSKLFEKHRRDLHTQVFRDAYKDLEETNTYNTEERAKELSEKSLLEMLLPANVQFVIRVDERTKRLVLNGEMLDDATLGNLHAEAMSLVSSNLWNILHNTPKKLAEEALFIKSESLADLQKGKTMLYTLATQQKILDILTSYQHK